MHNGPSAPGSQLSSIHPADRRSIGHDGVQGDVEFRPVPKMQDCFPASEKLHKEVVHQPTGEVLRVSVAGNPGTLCSFHVEPPQSQKPRELFAPRNAARYSCQPPFEPSATPTTPTSYHQCASCDPAGLHAFDLAVTDLSNPLSDPQCCRCLTARSP